MFTIALANQKGGVGKTTSTINLAQALTTKGKRVLMIDADPQASLTIYTGNEPDVLAEERRTLMDVLTGEREVSDVILKTDAGDLIASSLDLSAAEVELQQFGSATLREALRSVSDRYDFAVVDCPPSLSIITVTALAASTAVIIPVKLDYLSMRGLKKFFETCDKLRRRGNPRLKVLGILPTQVNAHYNADKRSMEQLQEASDQMGVTIYDAIPRSTVYDNSAAFGQATIAQKPASPAVQNYNTLADAIIAGA